MSRSTSDGKADIRWGWYGLPEILWIDDGWKHGAFGDKTPTFGCLCQPVFNCAFISQQFVRLRHLMRIANWNRTSEKSGFYLGMDMSNGKLQLLNARRTKLGSLVMSQLPALLPVPVVSFQQVRTSK